MYLISQGPPAGGVGANPPFIHRTHRAVQSYPGHHFGVNEVAAWTPHLPNALIGFVPCSFKKFEQRQGYALTPVSWFQPRLPALEQCIDKLSKNIQLKLLVGCIAGPHRRRFLVSGKPVKFEFCEPALSVQSINDA